MRKLTIETQQRTYDSPGKDPQDKWVVTHSLTVPDEATLAAILEAIAETLKPKR